MPTWTKLDYEYFARVLRESNAAIGETERLAAQFGGEFAADNPNFDAAGFMRAVKTGELTRESGKSAVRPGRRRWSRQTYEMVARVLRDAEVVPATRRGLALRFAADFRTDNPAFDTTRFEAAYESSLYRPAFRVQRRPGDIPVVSHLRRRPRRSIVDRFGHRIRVKEWPSSAGMATLRRHMKRRHPIAWRLSVMKGVRTRRRRREEAS